MGYEYNRKYREKGVEDMKVFKYLKETKIKRLDADERILFLADKLIKEVKNSGRKATFEQDGKVVIPATINIKVHNYFKSLRLFVECLHHGWEIYGDYKE